MTIPASTIANVLPGVLSAGGNGLVMQGLVLTQNTLMPTGSVQSFPSASAVSSFFGPASAEYAYASIYFAGYENSTILPSSILFAPFNASARAAWLQSGNMAAVTLTELQALSGVLTITFAGTPLTSSTITLSGATSFSDAATLIEAGFTSPPFSVAWNPVNSTFVFTSTATGATETITYATGTLAAGLLLTQATGATLSQGAAQDTYTSALNNVNAITQNWATVSYLVEPDIADKETMAAWLSDQNFQYLGIMWDSDPQASVSGATEPFGVVAKANNYNGVLCIGGDPAVGSLGPICMNIAAFVQGMIAAINYSATNGSIDFAGKSSPSAAVIPSCANIATYSNLLANGYSCYGAFASRNQGFTFFSNGNTPGLIPWGDLFIDQIWLNAQFQLALMTLYTSVPKIPEDPYGVGLIRSALVGQNNTGQATDNGPINNALNNGVIQTGVPLTSEQVAAINAAAGYSGAATSVQNNGYYLKITFSGTVANIYFWYSSGGEVLSFQMSSVDVLAG